MCIAITFRDQPEHECRRNENGHSSLSRREAESLPHFSEFETTILLNHESNDKWIQPALDIAALKV